MLIVKKSFPYFKQNVHFFLCCPTDFTDLNTRRGFVFISGHETNAWWHLACRVIGEYSDRKHIPYQKKVQM